MDKRVDELEGKQLSDQNKAELIIEHANLVEAVRCDANVHSFCDEETCAKDYCLLFHTARQFKLSEVPSQAAWTGMNWQRWSRSNARMATLWSAMYPAIDSALYTTLAHTCT